MSLGVSAAALEAASRDLMIHWEQAQATWNDAKSREFAKEWLEELPMMASQATKIMQEIDNLIRKVRNDCE